MARTRRWRALGVTLGVVAIGPCAAAPAAEQPALIVQIDDRVQVSLGELAAAKAEVERVFRAAGIEMVWHEGRLPATLRGLTAGEGRPGLVGVMLTHNIEKPSRDASGCPLGVAMPALAIAHVFYNRLVEVARTHPIDINAVLGRVIAHEIGHLLLPLGSHSRYGIMRADLDLGFVNPNRFTDDQARSIRAELESRSARR